MGRHGSADLAWFLVDGYSLAGVNTEFSDSVEGTLEDTTCFAATDEAQAYTGVQKLTLSQKGFFDDAAGSQNLALVGSIGSTRVVCYCLAGNTVGKGFVGFRGALETKYIRTPARYQLHKASADYVGAGHCDQEGVILHPLATESASTGNTQATSVDGGGATTNGAEAYLQCTALALGGGTNFVVRLQDSADNATFADVTGGAFTALTTVGAQALSISGTIREYVAIRWSYGGSPSGESATFFSGIQRL